MDRMIDQLGRPQKEPQMRVKLGKLLKTNKKGSTFDELMRFNLNKEFTQIEKQMNMVQGAEQFVASMDKKDRVVKFSLPHIGHS